MGPIIWSGVGDANVIRPLQILTKTLFWFHDLIHFSVNFSLPKHCSKPRNKFNGFSSWNWTWPLTKFVNVCGHVIHVYSCSWKQCRKTWVALELKCGHPTFHAIARCCVIKSLIINYDYRHITITKQEHYYAASCYNMKCWMSTLKLQRDPGLPVVLPRTRVHVNDVTAYIHKLS